VSAFESEGIRDIGVMQANHPRTDTLARVQVASVQTLARREIPEAELVIVDECHQRAKVIEELMRDRPDVYFIGLSATPWAKGMGLLWQDLVIPCTIGELIENDFLSRFTVYAPDVPDLSGVSTKAGDYAEGETAEVMAGKALMASVVETWLAKAANRPTLLFGVNCAHALALFEEFQRAGVAAAYVDANTDSVERQLIERRFRSGEVKVACSVRTLTTGIDWPVSCIIDAAPTRSEMLHVQKIGRGLRINDGTEDLMVLDHAGNSLRLGLVTDIHHDRLDCTKPGERQPRKTPERLPKECSKCAVLHTGRTCPSCGHERKPQAGVDTVEGELVQLNGAKAKANRAEKQRWHSALLWLAGQRGYSRGWAAHKYRERFGVWPRGMADVPVPADPEIMNWVKSRQIAFAKRQQRRVG
jgi:superfamily II DNA or RNA helicase